MYNKDIKESKLLLVHFRSLCRSRGQASPN